MWLRMRQFWTEEKWIRVTDEEQALEFVGINIPITAVEKLLEQQSGKSIDQLKKINGEAVDAFIQQETMTNPAMGQVVETRNDVKTLDMDIILEEVQETATLQQEQFETLANLAGTRVDPVMFETLLELSVMKNKDKILQKFKGDDDQAKAQAAMQQEAMQIEKAEKIADIKQKEADTQKTLSEIQLNEAKTKDELASAIERVGKTSTLPLQ